MILQLEATRNEIVHTVEDIPDTLFNEKESENSWSIGQVLDHLLKTEVEIRRAIKYMLTLPEQEPLPDKPLALTLDRSQRRIAPESISPTKEFVKKQEILSSLSESRKQLFQLIDTIPSEKDLTKTRFKHPFLKELSLKQWIEFVGYHEKRHLAQILEIKQSITNESV
ncbi:DinB family protein [Metabacillus litoralis]|uniref:DinB family protein n=1 Tax=Metabacillus litoralis TaxID=152268 RepID=UPI001CFD91B2|nr:DinB family protein [Metabacillus litoralis]